MIPTMLVAADRKCRQLRDRHRPRHRGIIISCAALHTDTDAGIHTLTYAANELNQYTQIATNGSDFIPEYDAELALVYYNYRYYNPLDGRWTRRDPIGIEGGVNLYGYVKNKCYICDLTGLSDDGWLDVISDALKWATGFQPRNSNYNGDSPETIAVKNSDIGNTLRNAFAEKNNNCKTCSCWKGIDNYAYRFPSIKDYFLLWLIAIEKEIPGLDGTRTAKSEAGQTAILHWMRFYYNLMTSPRGSFIGSCRGDISVHIIQEEGASYINVTYTVTNTTSLKSLFAQLLPDLEYPGPMGNWTQTYTWSEIIPCCNDND